MKLIFILFCILFTGKSCDDLKPQNKINLITYQASTRGSLLEISVYPEKLFYNDEIINISSENWNTITQLLNDINLDSIHELEAPSQNRYRDAAMTANIKIVTLNKAYVSSEFDHGNPPQALKLVVNEILSLANIIDND